ncbi:hypothetical protein D3C85_580290 [compost metagenome]
MLGAVELRIRVHVGERVAQFTQVVGDGLGRIVGLGGREGLVRLDLHQFVDFLVQAQQIAGQLDATDLVGLAFMDGDRDADILAIRRNRDLGRLDREFQVALVKVERAQAFQVAFELFARILVGIGVPGKPTRRRQLELVKQVAFRKCLVADEADFLNARDRTFEHVEAHADAVARQRRHGGGHFDAVLALGQVLLLQFVFRAFQHGTVENAAFGKTHLAQRRGDRLGVELAHAVEVHGCDGRTFLHHHDHDIIVGLDLHVGEKTRAVQAANRFGGFFFSEFLSDLHRKITKDGAGVGPLNTLYADIPHDKGVEGVGHGRKQQRGDQTWHYARQYTLFVMKHPAKRHP